MWQRCEPTKSEKTDDLKEDGEGRIVISVPISVEICRQLGRSRL